MGKPEERKPFGRRRHRREDNIKNDFREIGSGALDLIDLAQDKGR
jgi:hypothetical protein